MAIDPRLYEKLSGRKGDPYSRMGEALAQDAKAKSRREAEKDKSISERQFEAKIKMKLVWWGIVVAVVGVGAWIKLFR